MREPAIAILNEYFDLDPSLSSGLKWSTKEVNKFNANAGKPAGWKDSHGYYKVQLLGKTYGCHRLILLMNGVSPPQGCNEVDHLDRDPSNNLLSNLRWVSHSTNISNRHYKNSIGWRYVSQAFSRVKAQYVHPRTKLKIHVGTFDDPYEAHLAALAHRLENHWIER